MIAIATDNDSLLPLGKFKDQVVRGPDRQDFPQPLRRASNSRQAPLRRLQFFHTGDMQNGAIDTPSRNPILVQVQADFNFILRHKYRIVMGHFVTATV